MKTEDFHSIKRLLGKFFTRENLRAVRRYDSKNRIIALILGVMLWLLFAMKTAENSKYWFQIQGVTVNYDTAAALEEGIWLDDSMPITVDLNVAKSFNNRDYQDTKNSFEIKLNTNKILAEVRDKVSSGHPGTLTYVLSEKDVVRKPEKLSIRSFTPASINIKWDRLITRQVPIHIEKDTSALDRKIQVKLTPAKQLVSVTGPEFLVSQLDKVKSEELNITNARPPKKQATLKTGSKYISIAKDDQVIDCDLTYTNNSEIITHTIDGVRIRMLDRPDTMQVCDPGYEKMATTVRVTVSGPREKVDKLSANNIIAYCDLSSFSSTGFYSSNVQLIGVDKSIITVKSIKPDKIAVRLISLQAVMNEDAAATK